MFNISFGELLLIVFIAFIIIGPADFPKVLRECVKAIKYAKNLFGEIMASVSIEEEIKSVKNSLEDSSKDIVSELNEINNELN